MRTLAGLHGPVTGEMRVNALFAVRVACCDVAELLLGRDEGVDDIGVEMRAPGNDNGLHDVLMRRRGVVQTVAREGVVDIRKRGQARRDRNVVPTQSAGVSTAVP